MLADVRPLRLAVLVALGATVLMATPASAFVRKLLGPAPDGGGRHYAWWPTRAVGYRVQSDCAPLNPEVVDAGESATEFGLACREAIAISFQAWQQAGSGPGTSPCTDMVLRELGETAIREVGYNPTDPNEGNLILFQPHQCLGLVALSDPCWEDDSCDAKYACFSGGPEIVASTFLTGNLSDGVILDADIEVNAAPPPGGQDFSAEVGAPLPATADIQNALTHEIGHLLGLDHNCGYSGAPSCTAALMEGTMYGGAETPGETVKRTLKADDIAGMCHVYPTGVDTRTVNLSDTVPPEVPTKTGCASTEGGPAPTGLGLALALLLARRRQHP
jgi:MYXO-CTERM domain-containing protein